MTALAKLFRTTVFKVSLAYLIITAIGAGLVLSSVGDNVKMLIDQQIANTVAADISGLSEQYAQGGVNGLARSLDARIQRPGADLYLLTTSAGVPMVGNIASLPPEVLERSGLVEIVYQPAGEDRSHQRRALARIFGLPGGFRLVVGHDLEEAESLRKILRDALFTSLLWLIAIGAVGGLWVARRVLNRVDAINARARGIVVGGDLSGRLPVAGTGDELDRLVMNLNAMLDRISILMSGLKQVTDNIAHDLKTPLTRMRGRAEAALRFGAGAEDYRGALEKVIEESDRLIQIFDALLKIARAEAGAAPEGIEDFDVGAVVADVGELYEPAVEERGLALDLDIAPNLYAHGSRELIGQAVVNLVDNALKYGAEPGGDETMESESAALRRVRLCARRGEGAIEVVVADHGRGVPEADRARVLDRFVRLENSRSRPGSGLGLSLAAAVARLHQGSLRLEDNEPGLRVVLRLPAVARPKDVVAAPAVLPPGAAA